MALGNYVLILRSSSTETKLNSFCYLLVFSESVVGVVATVDVFSRVMQQLQIRPPLQRSKGLPPSMIQEMLRLQSKTLPLYQQVCGITEKVICSDVRK